MDVQKDFADLCALWNANLQGTRIWRLQGAGQAKARARRKLEASARAAEKRPSQLKAADIEALERPMQ